MNKTLAEMHRKAFVYEYASRSTNPSIASMVRDAEKRREEWQEWENRQESQP